MWNFQISKFAICLLGLILCSTGHAVEGKRKLRVGFIDSMGYPLVITKSVNGDLGILIELSNAIGKVLKVEVENVPLPRKRIEKALLDGITDMTCFMSPQWTKYSKNFEWSIPNLKQVEYPVVRRGSPMPSKIPDDYKGKSIALMLGYNYSSIQQLFDQKISYRLDKTNLEEQFNALENSKEVDLIITSQYEIEGYFHKFPEKRKLFEVGSMPFSEVRTQCMLSKMGNWKVDEINRAIRHLQDTKALKKMIKHY